AGLP
ncbi:DNA polymerase, partial [Escherichia coli ARS4.2123]